MSGLCQPPEQVFELNMGQLAGTQYQELLQEQLPEQVDHCQFALVAFKSHGSNWALKSPEIVHNLDQK